MPGSFTFWLIVLVVLVAYLFVSIELRFRAEWARRRAQERQYPGRAFDVSAIAPKVQRVRQSHLAFARCRPGPAVHRVALIAAARRFVTTLSYFRHHRREHATEKHVA